MKINIKEKVPDLLYKSTDMSTDFFYLGDTGHVNSDASGDLLNKGIAQIFKNMYFVCLSKLSFLLIVNSQNIIILFSRCKPGYINILQWHYNY